MTVMSTHMQPEVKHPTGAPLQLPSRMMSIARCCEPVRLVLAVGTGFVHHEFYNGQKFPGAEDGLHIAQDLLRIP